METWKAVRGYEGRYEVSDLGRVRSLPKRRQPNTIILKTPPAADGYPVVNLSNVEGRRSVKKVHRLVLEAFCGPGTIMHPFALHRDGDRTNARLSNLYWGNARENQLDREAHGTSNHGERNGSSKLTKSQAQSIRERLTNRKRGDLTEVAREYSVSISTVRDIAEGKTWSDL